MLHTPPAEIARIAHNTVKAYREAMGDFSVVDWNSADPHVREKLIDFVHIYSENPTDTPETLHQIWMDLKIDNGWAHGDKLDWTKLEHPDLLPYELLSDLRRAADAITWAVIREAMK
ncbi:RyR domain containing protein [Stenotrophomonas maltophilia phage vB_SmaM_Ps15]|uniref:RyR domain containing protein n=1 Tax=Stenotrophomonas maltophilia phage vB_SmaM_Ps15 TaxID=3071007 RepID=A0AAE9FP15_9CAUD|nr:RyR domain containing protein [Stenotrophomonas maltophilia phage vB_SmaM_Ps15]UMO77247.1 RyR domain containing protein [Stenotrophomonas maltophilia phage vB_SmaM_Ps15]